MFLFFVDKSSAEQRNISFSDTIKWLKFFLEDHSYIATLSKIIEFCVRFITTFLLTLTNAYLCVCINIDCIY